jgi:hypothetical protein
MKSSIALCSSLLLATSLAAKPDARSDAKAPAPLANVVVLIIRHAEKPDSGVGLSPAGEERARRYVDYFGNFSIGSKRVKVDCIFATADSNASHRPRLTVQPFSQAAGLAIDSRYKDKQVHELATDVLTVPHGHCLLICWHHGEIPDVLHALGAEPGQLVPKQKWPESVFGWVIQLRYDENGKLAEAKRINENLMPDDTAKHE